MGRRRLLPPLLIAVFACSPQEPLRVGVIVSQSLESAALFAEADINAAGGINGRPIDIVIKQAANALSAAEAIQIATEFANDASVIAVIGHSNSAASLAAAQIYNEFGLLQIAPTSTAPALREAGPFTLRLVPNDLEQAAFLVDYITQSTRSAHAAVVYVNDDYGRGLYQEVRARLAQAGARPVFEASYSNTIEPDVLLRMAARLAETKPQVLLWLGRPPALREIMPVLHATLPELEIIGSDGLETSLLYSNRDRVFDGVIFVRFLDPTRPELADLQQRFQAEQNVVLSTEGLLAYDGIRLVAHVLRSGARTRQEVRDGVAQIGRSRPAYQARTGLIRFDTLGENDRAYMLARVTTHGVESVSQRSARTP